MSGEALAVLTHLKQRHNITICVTPHVDHMEHIQIEPLQLRPVHRFFTLVFLHACFQWPRWTAWDQMFLPAVVSRRIAQISDVQEKKAEVHCLRGIQAKGAKTFHSCYGEHCLFRMSHPVQLHMRCARTKKFRPGYTCRFESDFLLSRLIRARMYFPRRRLNAIAVARARMHAAERACAAYGS